MTPQEKLSIIAEAFAVVDDVTADGNRAANARQRIRDVLAGVEISVVSCAVVDAVNREAADTIAKLTADNAALAVAARAERDAARARLVDVEAERDAARNEACLLDAGSEGLQRELARVKAEAEGLRQRVDKNIHLRVAAEERARDVTASAIALKAEAEGLRDFAASPSIWWSVAADGAIIHAELEGCSAIAKFADSSLRLVRADGEVLADLIVRARNETEKPQAAIEEIGAALLWSHRRSLRRAALASPTPAPDDISATSVIVKGGAP